jgi:hypothetical protein
MAPYGTLWHPVVPEELLRRPIVPEAPYGTRDVCALLLCNDYISDIRLALTNRDALQAVALLAHGLNNSWQAVMCCQERTRRVGQRASALVPALQELERVLRVPGHGVELRTVQSLSSMLVLLAKVSLLCCSQLRDNV